MFISSFLKQTTAPAFVQEPRVIALPQPDLFSACIGENSQPGADSTNGNLSENQADNDAGLSAAAEAPKPSIQEIIPEIHSEPFSLRKYFSGKGFKVDFSNNREVISAIESLAFQIALSYSQTKQFIRFLRENITKKSFSFTYALTGLSPAERTATVSLFFKLADYGIISNEFHNKVSNTLYGSISTAPRVINFINGDFMEMYAKSVAQNVIKNAAEQHDCDYELYSNAIIEKNGDSHELDLVFRIGKKVFWSEIKSGKFDPDEYRKLGILMGVVPDKCIFLAAEKTSADICDSLSYFYEYYVCNVATFKNKLSQMINNAFTAEEESK